MYNIFHNIGSDGNIYLFFKFLNFILQSTNLHSFFLFEFGESRMSMVQLDLKPIDLITKLDKFTLFGSSQLV